MRRQKLLTLFSSGYSQIAIIFPYVVAAPRYFAGAFQLGELMQTAQAFGQVQTALVLVRDELHRSRGLEGNRQPACWLRAGTCRCGPEKPQRADANRGSGRAGSLGFKGEYLLAGRLAAAHRPELPVSRRKPHSHIRAVRDGQKYADADAFRDMALLRWKSLPARGRPDTVLPQKPYLPLGTLRDARMLPNAAVKLRKDEVKAALGVCGMDAFAARLEEQANWAMQLSPGEQQRLAFCARCSCARTGCFSMRRRRPWTRNSEATLYASILESLAGLCGH